MTVEAESKRKVLINASNLHVGGGVQVAASFILELSRMNLRLPNVECFVFASTAVDRNLAASGFDSRALSNYEVLDVHGLGALKRRNVARFCGFDLVFTIFGPLYAAKRLRNHVVGFAQPWIIYPDNEVAERLPMKERLLLKLKFAIQWQFFRSADRLVVELRHVKDRLVANKRFPAGRIDVVPNCVSAIYFDESKWATVPGTDERPDNEIRLGYVTRDYPHKNLDFLLRVGKELKLIGQRRYRFFVTLTPDEWAAKNFEFKEYVSNVGPLTVAQCPTFYRAMDAVFFPSLLECFSATPLEALAMRRALFATDRSFVRDCCGENALYFDPLDARQAAKRIDEWFSFTPLQLRQAHIERSYRHLGSLSGSRERAVAYIEIIRKQLSL